MAYEAATGLLAMESGVVLTDDRLFGYSTDGNVGADGLIEIKCLASAEAIVDMWRTRDMSEYMHQMQGGMWITGRKWCDFVMYCPQLAPIGK
ncbi:YqaJ viral recombinase family protein, partial [Acinetobacter baumannii]|nr:YqaJ viral recombinase family protein [Acinetobacter baumannii]